MHRMCYNGTDRNTFRADSHLQRENALAVSVLFAWLGVPSVRYKNIKTMSETLGWNRADDLSTPRTERQHLFSVRGVLFISFERRKTDEH